MSDDDYWDVVVNPDGSWDINSTSNINLADISDGDGKLDLEKVELEPVYEFETYIRPWDGEEVEAKTGISAKEFQRIHFKGKIGDDL